MLLPVDARNRTSARAKGRGVGIGVEVGLVAGLGVTVGSEGGVVVAVGQGVGVVGDRAALGASGTAVGGGASEGAGVGAKVGLGRAVAVGKAAMVASTAAAIAAWMSKVGVVGNCEVASRIGGGGVGVVGDEFAQAVDASAKSTNTPDATDLFFWINESSIMTSRHFLSHRTPQPLWVSLT